MYLQGVTEQEMPQHDDNTYVNILTDTDSYSKSVCKIDTRTEERIVSTKHYDK